MLFPDAQNEAAEGARDRSHRLKALGDSEGKDKEKKTRGGGKKKDVRPSSSSSKLINDLDVDRVKKNVANVSERLGRTIKVSDRVDIHNDGDDNNDDDDDDFMEKKVIKVSPKREDPPTKPKTLKTVPSKGSSSPSKGRDRRTSSSSSSSSSQAKTKEEKKEERYAWLVDIRDANERPRSHPDYDKTTLFIPQEAYNSMTGFEQQVGSLSLSPFLFFVSFLDQPLIKMSFRLDRSGSTQYWDVKKKYFDTVVFFKKGKFYELYEFDADIGRKEFDLKLTDRINMKMVGVPEQSFDTWASRFLAHGHRITVVDHTESKLSQQRRNEEHSGGSRGGGGGGGSSKGKKTKKSESDKKDKIIQRDVTKVITPATITDEGLITDYTANYVLAIKESPIGLDSAAVSISCCIVDCTIGKFLICNWNEDVPDSLSPSLSSLTSFSPSVAPLHCSPVELFATQCLFSPFSFLISPLFLISFLFLIPFPVLMIRFLQPNNAEWAPRDQY